MNSQAAFSPYKFEHGILHNAGNTAFPTQISCWSSQTLRLCDDATHFGFVFQGHAQLVYDGQRYPLRPGMYFSVPSSCAIEAQDGTRGIVASRMNYQGVFHLGGPVETKGRLRYIDGCTDSLLIAPVMMGDPCLNLLHIPPNTAQTQHTHPSLRAGIIVSGTGTCITLEGDYPLAAGTMFLIPADGQHSFHTNADALRVIAYHPESDFGPTHENHPMVNKTIIGS